MKQLRVERGAGQFFGGKNLMCCGSLFSLSLSLSLFFLRERLLLVGYMCDKNNYLRSTLNYSYSVVTVSYETFSSRKMEAPRPNQ